MGRRELITILFSILLLFIPLCTKAIVADPKPKTITQPDGTTLTITLHGDEFLHWTTVGTRLVEMGSDGFYYYATFNEDGTKRITGSRATNSSIIRNSNPVTPPPSAVALANQRRAMRDNISKSSLISLGEKKFLVLLIEFDDLSFTVPSSQQAFSNLLNENGYSYNGATGSSRDYYIENSMGAFTPSFDVYGPIKVDNGYAHYGSDEVYGYEATDKLLAEACRKIDREIDFSEYDLDSDGRVDNVFFFFAGHNEAEGGGEDRIWPHAWAIYREMVVLDGVQIFQFACTSEYNGYSGTNMANIGTFTHEFAHVIGLPDFYDTDYEENGSGNGLSLLSLMSGGSYNNNNCTPPYLNGIERNMLGWMDEFIIFKTSGEKTIKPISENKSYITYTDNPGEFYMYESRPAQGWDEYIGAEGLAIYHVDQSENLVHGYTASSLWNSGYNINSFADHQCFDLIESVDSENLFTYTSDLLWPGRMEKTEFTASSKPASKDWSGRASGADITNIRISGNDVHFNIEISNYTTIRGRVLNNKKEAVPNTTLTISPVVETTLSNGLKMVRSSNTESVTVTTDQNGEYMADISHFECSSIMVTAQAFGYSGHSSVFEITGKEIIYDITLLTYSEANGTVIKVHNDNSIATVGYDDPSMDNWAAFTLFNEEISPYDGLLINSISFHINESAYGSEEVGVFIKRGSEIIYTEAIPDDQVRYGSNNTVALKKDIALKPGEDYLFGYYIKAPQGFPLSMDEGPGVKGGSMLSFDGTEFWEISDYNFIISATLVENLSELENMGFAAILSEKEFYSAGDIFEFRLTEGPKEPTSVVWYFNDNLQNETQITLPSGEHIIKAIATYSDGSTDTMVLEILVQP